MSATIHWTPDTSGGIISSGSRSAVIEALEPIFGFPCTLNTDDLRILKAMASVYAYDPNPYTQIVDLIETHGAIRLHATY